MFIVFKTTSLAILEIFILGLLGFFIIRKKILSESSLTLFSDFVMNITFPAMIFVAILNKFNTTEFPDWWIYPLTSVIMIIVTCFIGWSITKIDTGIKEKGEFINLLAFQNLSYMPLPIIAALFPKELAEKYFIYTFLFFVSYAPLIVSIGILLMSNKGCSRTINIKNILNPPFVTICLSLIIASTGLKKFVPQTIINPLRSLGDCTIPLAMFVLGGVIYINHKNNFKINLKTLSEMSFLKLLAFPVLALFVINIFRLPKDLSFIIFIQSTMPPATTLINISKSYGGNSEFIGQSLFYLYLMCLITIPFWLGLYMYFY